MLPFLRIKNRLIKAFYYHSLHGITLVNIKNNSIKSSRKLSLPFIPRICEHTKEQQQQLKKILFLISKFYVYICILYHCMNMRLNQLFMLQWIPFDPSHLTFIRENVVVVVTHSVINFPLTYSLNCEQNISNFNHVFAWISIILFHFFLLNL